MSIKSILAFFSCICVCYGEILATNPQVAKLATQNQSAQAQFWENKGQIWKLGTETTAHEVKFSFENKGLKIFLLENGLAYQFEKIHYPEGYKHLDKFGKEVGERSRTAEANHKLRSQIRSSAPLTSRLETYRMDMQLVGANPHPRISQSGESTDFINFYNRNTLEVRGYQKITYHEVYPNIDWVIYTDKTGGVKYDFVARANADISKIKIRFKDHEKAQINPDGSFTLSNSMGSITEQAPISFQNGKNVPTHFVYQNDILTFGLADYDKTQDLVIDPNLLWATYYGGNNSEQGSNCVLDAVGNVYLAGSTRSTNAIASGGHQNNLSVGFGDAFLVKFNSAGVRLWATYYGGTDDERNSECVVDASENIYLAGFTYSTNAIASGGHQNTFGGDSDAYLVKFNSAGVRLWATYYGGTNEEQVSSCAVDASGNIYLTGGTNSTNAIASGGHQNTYGGGAGGQGGGVGGGDGDAFLVKFNSAGVRLWATYYGGTNDDMSSTCVVSASGNIYLSGTAKSTNAIASGGYQNSHGGGFNGFLVKFNPAGSRLWATYYGSGFTFGGGCAIDANENIYWAGNTNATNNISSGGHQNIYGGGSITGDAFLVKFNSAGSRLWATYYGGTNDDGGGTCVVDASGNIYLSGYTKSSNAIASQGYQNTFGGDYDAYLVKFNPAGARIWATYYGGNDYDEGGSCMVDASGNIYLAGLTRSTNAIASGGHQNTYGGSSDAFLVKFDSILCQFISNTLTQTICSNQTFLFNGINRNTSGAYLDTLVAANGCDSFLTLNLTVTPTRTGSISQTICAGQSFFFNGLNRNTSGAYLDTLVATNGCDSFLTLNLTVTPTRTGSISQTICAGQTFFFNGVNRNTSGAYLDTLIAANGCDSFLTLNLTVTPTRTGSISQTICSNQSFFFNGLNRNTSGAYLDTLVATNGCDSFLTLNLTVTPTRTGSISQTICSNQSFFFNGVNRNTSGAYLDTLVAANGCDSFLTLNLTVLPTRTGSFSQTICAGQTFFFNGFNRNTSGAYLDTLVAANGCDSFLTLNLTIISIDTFVSQQGNTLTARQTGATYQWVQCPATPILGANSATFTPTVTGNYAVSISLVGCSALSSCRSITVTPTSVENIDNQININIYPNPNTGEFFVEHKLDFAHIRVSDLLGRTIHSQISQQENTTIITIPQAAEGIYIVSILDKNHVQVAQSKILVQP